MAAAQNAVKFVILKIQSCTLIRLTENRIRRKRIGFGIFEKTK